MSNLVTLNLDDFKKLVRGEIVSQGDLQVSLQDIGHLQMYNAWSDAIALRTVHGEYWLKMEEGERQMLLLALAELALSRPGWDAALKAISQRIDNKDASMYDALKKSNADRVNAERMPLLPVEYQVHDNEEIRRWIHGINQHEPTRPGDFLLAFAAAVCRADNTNYPVLRPCIVALMRKFPNYRFTGDL